MTRVRYASKIVKNRKLSGQKFIFTFTHYSESTIQLVVLTAIVYIITCIIVTSGVLI